MGIKRYNFSNFKIEFVNSFKNSSTRKDLFESFLKWASNILEISPPKYIWIGGSFITTKLNPNDIDIVLFYDPDDYKAKRTEIKFYVEVISKVLFKIDSYIACSEKKSLNVNERKIVRRRKNYWRNKFGKDENNKIIDIIKISGAELKEYVNKNNK